MINETSTEFHVDLYVGFSGEILNVITENSGGGCDELNIKWTF